MTTEEIAAGLSEAQKRAVLAMPMPYEINTVMQGKIMVNTCATAKEIGAHGATLQSLYGFGGVDEKTLLLGPILVACDWGEGGKRYWHITETGLAVRAILESNHDRA